MTVTLAPVRTCVGCGARDAQAALLRVQLDDAGTPVLVTRAKSGRSAYVHASLACAARLPKSKGLSRSLRTTLGNSDRALLRRMIEDKFSSVQSQRPAPSFGDITASE